MRQYDLLTDWERMQSNILPLKDEWESFIRTGKVSNDNIIRAEILSSWMRCRERGLDPYSHVCETISWEEITRRQQRNKKNLDIAGPLLREMAEGIKDTGVRFDYFDEELYLLARFGGEREAALPPKRDLPLGICFKEAQSGTNAANMAMLLEKPMQMMSYEHYCTAHHDFTCSAVPIRNANGQIVAVISVDLYCWPIHKHTLGMLIALRRSIEYSMFLDSQKSDAELEMTLVKEALDVIDQPMVIVNAAGVVMAENRAAKDVLNGGREIILGTSCETLWGERNPFTETIVSKKPIHNREVIFGIDRGTLRLIGDVRPVFNSSRQLTFVSGIFKERPTSASDIKNRGAWKAYYTFENLIGESAELRQTIRLAKETAKIESNTLIQGESGTGKELFAQAIHNSSNYKDGPFVAVNCSAIPFGLLESELFGYEKGAFTGANKEGRAGKFEVACGGTIFLDEINSMPLDMQSKILRVIQNKSITRVGGNEQISINIRIIAATNVDLWRMVKEGKFREDLFYRINVITIVLPSLRERREDIPLLIDNVVRKISNQAQMKLQIDEEALEILQNYPWPGNIRELENVIERSMVITRAADSTVISKNVLLKNPGIANFAYDKLEQHEKEKPVKQEFLEATVAERSLKEFEKEEIERVLEKNSYNISKAAKEMGVVRNTLYNKMKRYEIRGK